MTRWRAFWLGVASIFGELHDPLLALPISGEQTDTDKLDGDWRKVLTDMDNIRRIHRKMTPRTGL